ncbi:MAG: SDR family oxidoreductase, partial [Candidatus Thermoplasmatota archaeon]|nr:SDR family oxidoreductase [Candidatus Thermoplasmatota archaeon]
IIDSIKYWMKEYHIDGFRFDLMGLHDIDTMNKVAQEALKIVKEKGSDGVLLKGDVSNNDDVEKIVKTFIKKTKTIDILVNNAGIYKRQEFNDISLEDWNKTLSVNLTGCFNLCKQVLPFMKPCGKIIFISSQLALKGSAHGAHYAASKAAVLGLVRSLALELASKKINVNAVAPGTIDTNIIAGYTQDERQRRINEIPLKRLGTPEDVANTCLFLASDLSNYITGETINVNGGLYIQ